VSSLLIALMIGGTLGAVLGRFGQCSSGACPLTANWKRGAIYGAVLGLAFHFASGGSYQPPKNVKAISESDFEGEVTRAGKLVVVDFFATWCGPCKTLAPRLDALAGEYGNSIKFVSVNIDQAPSLATKFKVEGVPTLLFFGADGNMVDASVGLISVEALRSKLESLTTSVIAKPLAGPR
jgi:thioredoxin 1